MYMLHNKYHGENKIIADSLNKNKNLKKKKLQSEKNLQIISFSLDFTYVSFIWYKQNDGETYSKKCRWN